EDSSSEVLVRVVASQNQVFMDSMILYQNSSNRVLKRDLKSNDPVQVRLHHEFFKRGWFYEIKTGQEFDKRAKEDRNFRDQCNFGGIRNSEVAKALAAVRLHPSIAASQGDDYFFGDAYEDIFTSDLSTYNCLVPLTLKWLIYSSYLNARFHGFKKEWIFKNPARYFVLKVLYEFFANKPDSQKGWVSFWEIRDEESKEWKAFRSQVDRIIDSLFEVAYIGWRKTSKKSEIDHNGFFKSKAEVDKILGNKETLSLQKKAQKIFEQAVGNITQ
ncbi:AIPR family protein, partial [Candidatus Bathyarchaeota archaeon]|nr:AIPR family protein [Candidatus Bathyarchaeota archaeon]